MSMKIWIRRTLMVALALVSLSLAGCSGSIGVGMSVGVPVGNSGYMRVGGGRWY